MSKMSLDRYEPEMQAEILRQIKLRERRRKWIISLFSIVGISCMLYFSFYYYMANKNNNQFSKLAQIKESSEKGIFNSNPLLINKDVNGNITPPVLEKYKNLYNKNKRLIGWLKIDDTNIDYPVMQTVNNEYYLENNYNQEYDKNGSIFMDYECDVLKPSSNLILYGHNMKSGKMFGSLDKYSSKSYYESHPYIQFDTIYEEGTYEVMYVFRSQVYTEEEVAFKYYQFIDANSEEEFNSYMEEMAAMSIYDTNVTANYEDQLLTLSTCDYQEKDGRFVVVAKRIK